RREIHEGDVGALARVEHGDGAANLRVAAGDDRDHILQLARALVLGRHVVGAQLEVGFDPRLLEVLLRQRRLGLLADTGLRGALFLLPFLLLLLVGAIHLALDAAVLLAGILACGASTRARRAGRRRCALLSLGGVARRIASLRWAHLISLLRVE